MERTSSRTPGTRSPRRYVTAPPLTRTSGAEGAEVLEEIEGAPGVLLWATLRDVMLWLETPAAERAGIFPPGAGRERRAEVEGSGVDPALWAPLLIVAETMDAPADADPHRVAHACRAVAGWAEGSRAPATRLAFAQAAALARPEDPRLALATARLARDLAQPARAESWFRRTVKLARGNDWESYVRAFLGLGVMYHRGGNYPAAGAVVGRALRAARRRRLRPLEGDAHHELFVFALDAHRMREAYSHARAAMEAYGIHHPRLPHLAHDVGCFWAQQGRFELARPIFDQVLPCFEDEEVRVRVLANLARAAAALGERERYESHRGAAMELLPDTPAFGAEVLLLVSQGDLSMGEWDRASEAARKAVEIAGARGESHTRLTAEAILDRARTRVSGAAAAVPAESGAVARQAERLADELGRSLVTRREVLAG